MFINIYDYVYAYLHMIEKAYIYDVCVYVILCKFHVSRDNTHNIYVRLCSFDGLVY
jgi:hypothetical protein